MNVPGVATWVWPPDRVGLDPPLSRPADRSFSSAGRISSGNGRGKNDRGGERGRRMRLPAGGGPLRWCTEIVLGLCRSAVLVGLTGVMPVVAVPVGLGGSRVAYSMSAGSTSALVVRVLAAFGGTLLVMAWIAAAVLIVHMLTSRALSRAARRLAVRWLGLRIEVAYRPISPVTRMATGYWWDGREYHRSEREARRRAEQNARVRDPPAARSRGSGSSLSGFPTRSRGRTRSVPLAEEPRLPPAGSSGTRVECGRRFPWDRPGPPYRSHDAPPDGLRGTQSAAAPLPGHSRKCTRTPARSRC